MAILYWMPIEFNLGLVAGSLSSLRAWPVFRRLGFSLSSEHEKSTGETPHELGNVVRRDNKGGQWKRGLGMGATLLQETVNESQERIVVQSKTES
ncbi:hypothetical protein BDW59DRAFT_148320 [Aspergillus cavernicola]|uniref:Uncharacterized protein n=1 Tax=Aspergillus cavernicola TaxID=176166 RepID=A0ABR4I7Q3_9EURO